MSMDKDTEQDFSYLTVAAIAGSIVLFGVVLLGNMKGTNNGQASQRENMGIDGNRHDGPPSRSDRAVQPPADTRGAGAADAVLQDAPATFPLAPAQVVHRRRGGYADVGSNRALFDAIRHVESGGNDDAVGDCGLAHGPLQIHLGCFLDGGGKAADYPAQAHDWEASKRIALAYWKRYGAVSDRDKAVCWNVGPRWRTRAIDAGNAYWARVQKELNR